MAPLVAAAFLAMERQLPALPELEFHSSMVVRAA
jgi:hypothetical protein